MTNGLSPQAENGHTDIANEIVDMFCHYRISGEEWMVLWVILRKTYGWHKKEDFISLSQFVYQTGLKKTAVIRAINKLHSKKIIDVIKKDNTNVNLYRFNKRFDGWQPLSKKITTFIPEPTIKKHCYICNFTEALETHHIKSRSMGGSNKVENKITLCPNCHALVHNGKYTEQELINKKDNVENGNKKDNERKNISLSKKGHTKETTKDTKETIIQKKLNTQKKETPISPLKILTPIQQVVEHYKKVGNFQDIENWDKIYFPRYTKTAKQLLELCNGDIEEVKRAISEVIGYLQGEGLSWTLETVVKQFGHWQTGKLIPNKDKRLAGNLAAGQKFLERGENERDKV